MWTSGFFNSINGDRLYNADQMSRIFEGLITDGVYESVGNKLAVQPNNGMVIQIATGRGWFGRHWVNNDSEYALTLENPDVILNRYVAVCIRVDDSDAVRDAVPYLKYSEFATNPVKPTMERTELVKEYCLAYVYIKAGATAITASNIEDTRGNEALCGWVTGLITQISTATVFAQYDAIFNEFMTRETTGFNEFFDEQMEAFNEWFEGLQVQVDSNTATRLTNALPTSLTVTLSANGWELSNGAYKQTVTVAGMNDTKSVITNPSTDSLSSEIKCSGQSTNALEFTAVSLPTADVTVDILHMGV